MDLKLKNQTNNREILAQKYRGARYSFGYPACPNVSDSNIQLSLLDAKRINLTMDESEQFILNKVLQLLFHFTQKLNTSAHK